MRSTELSVCAITHVYVHVASEQHPNAPLRASMQTRIGNCSLVHMHMPFGASQQTCDAGYH
jgi:hypothetical protein